MNLKTVRVSELKQAKKIPDSAYIPIVRDGTTYKITYADFKKSIIDDILEVSARVDKTEADIDYIAMMCDIDFMADETEMEGIDDVVSED